MVEAKRVGGVWSTSALPPALNIVPDMVAIYARKASANGRGRRQMPSTTRAAQAREALREVRKLHPYRNPALLILPAAGGSQAFSGGSRSRLGDPRPKPSSTRKPSNPLSPQAPRGPAQLPQALVPHPCNDIFSPARVPPEVP